MRTSFTLLFCAALPFITACDTTHAKVPAVDHASALLLVQADLTDLTQTPSDAQWSRTYRHFDQYVEPYLGTADRLALEVRFGTLRSAVQAKHRDPTQIARLCEAIATDLQPQD